MPRHRVSLGPKKRMTVYFDPDTYARIGALAESQNMSATRVVETLFLRELARVSGEQVERDALPVIRDVIESVLRRELTTMAARLTTLTQKGVRASAMSAALVEEVARHLDAEKADAWVAAAEKAAGRRLAERTPPGD